MHFGSCNSHILSRITSAFNLIVVFIHLQISRDCQELEPSIGEQLASLLYLEPDSELMVC